MSEKNFNQLKRYACETADEQSFSSAFPFFCMRIFFSNLNEDQIYFAIDGLGSNDESIDAFWINEENKTINIAQFKSVASEANISSAKKETFAYLSAVEEKLLDNDYIENHRNTRIRNEIAHEYRQHKHFSYSVNKYLFHLGHSTKEITDFYSDITYVDYEEIFEKWDEYNSINSLTDPEEFNLHVTFNEVNRDENYGKIIRFKPTSKYSTIITLISGEELVKIRRKYKYQLFDRNVRYYLGTENKINKEIYETAKNKPDNFYYFNNGITITCSRCKESVVHDEVRMTLELPQIINGAQTVNAVYEAFNDMLRKRMTETLDPEKSEKECFQHFSRLKVLCRIIESTKHAEADFSTNLTRYNNSQNSVNIADFYANRPEQVELQRKLLKYGYFYERKRGEREQFKKNEENDFNVKFSELEFGSINLDLPILASAYQAYNGRPGAREVGDKYILAANHNDYERLFGNSRADITDEKIRDIVLAINIFFSIAKYSKLYNKLAKTLGELETDRENEDLFKKFRVFLNSLTFLPHNIRENLLAANKYADIDQENVLKRIYNYRLLSQGKYILTALVKEILVMNGYQKQIMDNKLFSNSDYINNNIVTAWLSKMILRLVNPVRDKEREKRSDGAFFLDQNSFKSILEYLKDMIYDEDLDLKQEYPL